MSIINEALKKAQEKNEQLNKKDIKTAKPKREKIAIVPPVIPPRPDSKNKIIGMGLLIAVFVVISIFIKVKDIEKSPVTTGTEQVITTTISKSKINKNTGVLKKEPKQNIGITVYSPNDPEKISSDVTSDFELSGIVYGTGGQDYAIVNNKVLEIGDMIGDYKLITIEKDNIILFSGKKDIVLDLK